ncbi:MAG TPA: carboxymuconolactone decarboxylase family protein [Acidimicrobiales bacterium]|nr:carboxymuconolactone decarboxylase family protein [Acidimicrobiales bacterium]
MRRDDLDAPATRVWDALVETRGDDLIGEDGALRGPFNAWVHAPQLGEILTRLGHALRYDTSVDRRLVETAIITVGARYRAEFEWWAHSRMAGQHGVTDGVVDAIRAGTDPAPAGAPDDELVVHRVAAQLAASGRVDEDAYTAAVDLLGERGVVELVTLCGYYCLVCVTLNAFEVPLPPGATPAWPPSP